MKTPEEQLHTIATRLAEAITWIQVDGSPIVAPTPFDSGQHTRHLAQLFTHALVDAAEVGAAEARAGDAWTMKPLHAELLHNLLAHPAMGVSRIAVEAAAAAQRAATWLHDQTARRAWPAGER